MIDEAEMDRAMVAFEARAAILAPPRVEVDPYVIPWAQPLLLHHWLKGAKGGRSSGKSHHFAEQLVKRMAADPNLRVVCIREYQRSLRYSAKALIEAKIRELGVGHLFEILVPEIRRIGGDGVCIFEGMQSHTSDSIKSLEAFSIAWVEEAQTISQRSLDLLTPTIRSPGAELWFSWNPEQPDDPVEKLFEEDQTGPDPDSCVIHSTYLDNPYASAVTKRDAERRRRNDPDGYAHIWLGDYNKRSDAIVLSGKTFIEDFEPEKNWDGPYHGADWGFANDPTAAVRVWLADSSLWIEFESGGLQWSNDYTYRSFVADIPGIEGYVVRADPARPETISAVRDLGLKIKGARKWNGSVEDGVQYLRSFDRIVIHPRCTKTADEARLWSYKQDRLTGDPLPALIDKNNHYWDAVRYALSPLIRKGRAPQGHVSAPVTKLRATIEAAAERKHYGKTSPPSRVKAVIGGGRTVKLPKSQLARLHSSERKEEGG